MFFFCLCKEKSMLNMVFKIVESSLWMFSLHVFPVGTGKRKLVPTYFTYISLIGVLRIHVSLQWPSMSILLTTNTTNWFLGIQNLTLPFVVLKRNQEIEFSIANITSEFPCTVFWSFVSHEVRGAGKCFVADVTYVLFYVTVHYIFVSLSALGCRQLFATESTPRFSIT